MNLKETTTQEKPKPPYFKVKLSEIGRYINCGFYNTIYSKNATILLKQIIALSAKELVGKENIVDLIELTCLSFLHDIIEDFDEKFPEHKNITERIKKEFIYE